MAKRSATKLTSRRGSKSAVSTKGRSSAKKTAAKKRVRPGGSHVSFGLHGMREIVHTIREAGLERQFNAALGHDDKFVRVRRKSLRTIKEFVESKPKLASLAVAMGRCDCDPNDPYCIYI